MEKILLIDDDDPTRETLELYLNELNYKIFSANSGKRGLELLEFHHPDLVITDLKMPEIDGIAVLKKVKEFDNNIPVIVITAFDDMQSTIKAMQLGAYDYVEKPLDMAKLKFEVARALENSNLSKRLAFAISKDSEDYQIGNNFIGKTPKMKEIFKKIGQVSSSRVNVLIYGESGTGKELLTKVIHYSGITKDQPFIAVNSSALSENLLESELFGHVKGAFTGAVKDKKGKFELAGEGTIFLDEISEISSSLQTKLLRVLQEREFEKVGGETTIPMKARVVAATNRDLSKLVSEGKFREDLYYRLNVFKINVPPLRERKEDIPNLVVHFLMKINRELHKNVVKVPYDVIDMLQNYEWIGNVRELENTLMQAVLLAKGEVLEKDYILLKTNENHNRDYVNNEDLSLAEFEKEHIKFVLEKVKWEKKEAAKILKISRQTLYNKIETYSLKNNDNSENEF